MIGGGVGGFIAGITKIKAFSMVTPGLLSLISYVSESAPITNLIFAIVTGVVGFVLGFVLTLVFGFEEPSDEEIKELTSEA